MTEVKICGIRDPAAMDAVAEAGAEWVGFVFVSASPRAVTAVDAARLFARHTSGPHAVGLFVDPSDTDVERVLAAMPLAVLQVYAPASRAVALQSTFRVPVWQAIGIETGSDLPAQPTRVQRLLLDRRAQSDSPVPGGNARAFDWAVLRNWRAPMPWVLAGGLTPDNVGAAISATHAMTVDVSSGVERTRGVKDPALIRSFVAAVRSNEHRHAV